MNKELQNNNWYKELLLDLRKIEFTNIVIGKLAYGNRILQDLEKFESSGKRIENIAKDLKVSVGEIYRCKKFAEKVRENPDLSQTLRNLQLSWNQVITKYLYDSRKKEVKLLPLPKGKYNIIYADPAWKQWEGGYKDPVQHYDTMDLADIIKIPVSDIAADNCILFLWSTFPNLKEAMEVMEKWGFNYSTVGFVWIKSKKDKTGFAFGTGAWTRANAELCLIGLKGSIKRKDNTISQIIYEPRSKHSEKPNIVRKKIIQLVGDLPRIELFARQKEEGFEVWGNEAPKE